MAKMIFREITGDGFFLEGRRLGVPIIHVRTVLRQGGVDDVRGLKAAQAATAGA